MIEYGKPYTKMIIGRHNIVMIVMTMICSQLKIHFFLYSSMIFSGLLANCKDRYLRSVFVIKFVKGRLFSQASNRNSLACDNAPMPHHLSIRFCM